MNTPGNVIDGADWTRIDVSQNQIGVAVELSKEKNNKYILSSTENLKFEDGYVAITQLQKKYNILLDSPLRGHCILYL